MTTKELFGEFRRIAENPRAQMDSYAGKGMDTVLVAPVYTPEEIIHSMNLVPMGAWGADIPLNNAKKYFPAFICSIMQSILELGMNGTYSGAKAIVIPSLCDSLKCLGENWKYAVPGIPFIPMTYPQNRKPDYAHAYTKAGYERVIRDLEKATGRTFSDAALAESLALYNEHTHAMQEFAKAAARHPEITPRERSDVFKSATFMRKEDHLALLRELLSVLGTNGGAPTGADGDAQAGAEPVEVGSAGVSAPSAVKKRGIVTTGILADSPALLQIFEENNLYIAADDVAAESRQYSAESPEAGAKATGAAEGGTALDRLVEKFCARENCSVLYDPEKKRVEHIVRLAKETGASGVVVVLTKFCDPEEFDYPLIQKACDASGLPCVLVEVDRQMQNMEQARTLMQAFAENL